MFQLSSADFRCGGQRVLLKSSKNVGTQTKKGK